MTTHNLWPALSQIFDDLMKRRVRPPWRDPSADADQDYAEGIADAFKALQIKGILK